MDSPQASSSSGLFSSLPWLIIDFQGPDEEMVIDVTKSSEVVERKREKGSL